MRILIVEDNDADVFLIVEALGSAGLKFESEVATNGERLLEVMDRIVREPSTRCDAMILDVNLTTHDGLELLERLRATPILKQLPVIVLTSSTSPNDRKRAQKLGVLAYLEKSIDLDTFMNVGRRIAGLLAV